MDICFHVNRMAVYVEHIPNRNSPPAILIREAWREGKCIRRKTLAVESQFDPWDRLRINPKTRIRNSQLDSFLQERVHKVSES